MISKMGRSHHVGTTCPQSDRHWASSCGLYFVIIIIWKGSLFYNLRSPQGDCRDLVIFLFLSYSVLYIVCVIFRFADISQFHASSKSYFCNLDQYAQSNKSRQFKQHCQTRQHKKYNATILEYQTNEPALFCVILWLICTFAQKNAIIVDPPKRASNSYLIMIEKNIRIEFLQQNCRKMA